MISAVAVRILIGGFIDGSDESQSGLEVVLTAAFLVYVLGGGLAMVLLSYRSLRRSGLVCPHCKRLLVVPLAQIAVASGHCGKCGGQIVTAES